MFVLILQYFLVANLLVIILENSAVIAKYYYCTLLYHQGLQGVAQ